ncbi:MAG: glycosyltransferase family 2 protein [Gemmatimonadetes bacterium]|nr:glycosyltransferase family 2 protein [Gemmatimonadota bacterium]
MRLSVVVPSYNERNTIEAILARVRELPLSVELIVVDDGSNDGSDEILTLLEKRGVIDRLILHVRNRGKGAALRAGFQVATGHVVAIQDADLEYDPRHILEMLDPILRGWADAVYGSRFLGGQHRVHLFWHFVGNQGLTLLSNILTDLNLSDMETCHKVVRRDLLQTLPFTQDRFGIEPEITARLAQAGARIYELPISYRGRSYAEGKKIRWTDGVAAFWHILRSNLLPPRAVRWQRPEQDPWDEPQKASPAPHASESVAETEGR